MAAALAGAGRPTPSPAPTTPGYPPVAGTFTVDISFDGVPARGAGTITFVQASRQTDALSGRGNVVADAVERVTFTELRAAAMDRLGRIQFQLDAPGYDGTWQFEGALTGDWDAIHGVHVARAGDGTEACSGTWTAIRGAARGPSPTRGPRARE
jgi:hypothetical protein